MSANDIFSLKRPNNEPILSYEPGSQEKIELKTKLKELKNNPVEIPLIINGNEVKTGNTKEIRAPHNHDIVLGKYHMAGEKEVNEAIKASLAAKKEWENTSWEKRAAIFLKAASLLAGPKRAEINAATMLCQSKNVFQAEIDSACELIDFLRFNSYFMTEIYQNQPSSTEDILNRMEYRPLEGFIFAVPPFNFTSIGGNLPTAPALMGNTVLWKPASTAVYSNYFFMKLLMRAGLPAGVINFIPGKGSEVGPLVTKRKELAGIHFTGSVNTLNQMYKEVGTNVEKYNTYPRIVGETGGKDFIFAHHSADKDELITALVRGAFEYQGQKCSAASRSYIPNNLWPEIKDDLIKQTENLKMGPVDDFTNFINAVIDAPAFEKISGYIEYAKKAEDAEVIAGGEYDKSKGYYINPTIILTDNPKFKTMEEEIFGPVLTIYVYNKDEFEKTLQLCDQTSPYGLTGSIFAKDRKAVKIAEKFLKQAAGNFYINDKPTGAVVGQQPFGGARKSGTNDKAGSKWNLMRWVSPRSVKENLNPPTDYSYPFMKGE
ncbi:MAG TPA: L-glutamate gamma-semialdehyde dehydrogenase [Halanaerobiales bacterium]|nr:L-glutamate gamma-semialdehyde dehydrogenase [Halanaerobiales bacterium]